MGFVELHSTPLTTTSLSKSSFSDVQIRTALYALSTTPLKQEDNVHPVSQDMQLEMVWLVFLSKFAAMVYEKVLSNATTATLRVGTDAQQTALTLKVFIHATSPFQTLAFYAETINVTDLKRATT